MLKQSYLAIICILVVFITGCMAPPAPIGWAGASLANNALYVGGPGGNVYRMSLDGAREWQFPADSSKNIGKIFASPVISRETVYIAGSDRKVYALNAANGTPRWEWTINDEIVAPAQLSRDGATVYWTTTSGRVVAQDAVNGGEPKAQFSAKQAIWGQPTLDTQRNRLYVASLDRSVYALDAATLQPVWTRNVGGALTTAPLLVGDVLYIGSFDRQIRVLSVEDGSEREAISVGNAIFATPVVSGDMLYAGATDQTVFAVSLGDRTTKWKQSLGGRLVAGVALSTDNRTLFTVAEDQRLYAIDASNGAILWRSEVLDNKVFMTPVVTRDLVYVVSLGQQMYAYESDPSKNGQRRWVQNLTQPGPGAAPRPAGG